MGAAFEYAAPTPERPNDLSGYFQHPRHGIAPGCYTDDTQMSLAVAETLLEHGVAATALQFIEKFVLAFKRGSARGLCGPLLGVPEVRSRLGGLCGADLAGIGQIRSCNALLPDRRAAPYCGYPCPGGAPGTHHP
jgi:hypothetical protein